MDRSDWWNHGGTLLPQGYIYKPTQHSRLTSKMDMLSQAEDVDTAGNEIFGGARRARGHAKPRFTEAPFGEMSPAMASPRYRPHMQSPLDGGCLPSAVNESSEFVPFFNSDQPPKVIVDTRWRAGDTLPIALDGSPRQPHAMPVSRIVRDPELIGYASNGKEGYGGEMLFGQKPPERPPLNLDMQIAQWRPGHVGPHDPHPFTLNGAVPAPAPRKDPRRHIQPELMFSTQHDDHLAAEGARREMIRVQKAAGELAPGAAAALDADLATGFFPSPYAAKDPNASPNRSRWRAGDSEPFGFGEAIPTARDRNPIVNSSWRTYDKSGVGIAMGSDLVDARAVHGGASPRVPAERLYPSPPSARTPKNHVPRGGAEWQGGAESPGGVLVQAHDADRLLPLLTDELPIPSDEPAHRYISPPRVSRLAKHA